MGWLGRVLPWESIAALPRIALDVKKLGWKRDGADGEVAWDISYQSMDRGRPASLHRHFHPSYWELRPERQLGIEGLSSYRLDTAHM